MELCHATKASEPLTQMFSEPPRDLVHGQTTERTARGTANKGR